MNTPFIYAVLLAATVIVPAGAATDTDVYKCGDAEGHVFLTDRPCGPGLAPLPMASAAPDSGLLDTAAPATAPETGWSAADPDPALAVGVARAPSPGALLRAKPQRRALAIDIDTLKQAKLAMLSDDAAWASQRASRD